MRLALTLIVWMISFITHAQSAQVFISFSMPERLLIETLRDSAALQIPATLNGLYENSVEQTALKVMVLSKEIPELQIQIDPTAFERFNVKQVPALVISYGDCFDVIYGNLPLREGLSRIREKGGCSKRGAG